MPDHPKKPEQLSLSFDRDSTAEREPPSDTSNVISFEKAIEFHREVIRLRALKSIVAPSSDHHVQEG
jgi:hypothetical protein